jgi:hypothetical protein
MQTFYYIITALSAAMLLLKVIDMPAVVTGSSWENIEIKVILNYFD